jgi:hypothetical protein
MKPFEADEYVNGWDAAIAYKSRESNPWRGTSGAWDRYRENAWDSGWFHCSRGEAFHDPRKKRGAK